MDGTARRNDGIATAPLNDAYQGGPFLCRVNVHINLHWYALICTSTEVFAASPGSNAPYDTPLAENEEVQS